MFVRSAECMYRQSYSRVVFVSNVLNSSQYLIFYLLFSGEWSLPQVSVTEHWCDVLLVHHSCNVPVRGGGGAQLKTLRKNSERYCTVQLWSQYAYIMFMFV